MSAPSAPPLMTPRVLGAASGLRSAPWYTDPHMPSAPPLTAAIMYVQNTRSKPLDSPPVSSATRSEKRCENS